MCVQLTCDLLAIAEFLVYSLIYYCQVVGVYVCLATVGKVFIWLHMFFVSVLVLPGIGYRYHPETLKSRLAVVP